MPTLDFSNVRAIEPVPAGEYNATLTEIQYIAKSKSSGQPYIKLTFSISDGEFAGRKLFRNLSLQPDALWAYKQYMIALGTDADEFDGDVDVEETARENIGNDCVLVVDIREYEDSGVVRHQNEVKGIRDASFAA